MYKRNEESKEDTSLTVHLFGKESDKTWRATMNCRLVSFNPQIEAIQSQFEDIELNGKFPHYMLKVIKWNKLIDAQKRFIEMDSFNIEIDLIIQQKDDIPKKAVKRPATDNQNGIECTICMEDMKGRPASSTLCGHIFCTNCIINRFKLNNCVQFANDEQLRLNCIRFFCRMVRQPLTGKRMIHLLIFHFYFQMKAVVDIIGKGYLFYTSFFIICISS